MDWTDWNIIVQAIIFEMFEHIYIAVGAYERQTLDCPMLDTFYKMDIDYI